MFDVPAILVALAVSLITLIYRSVPHLRERVLFVVHGERPDGTHTKGTFSVGCLTTPFNYAWRIYTYGLANHALSMGLGSHPFAVFVMAASVLGILLSIVVIFAAATGMHMKREGKTNTLTKLSDFLGQGPNLVIKYTNLVLLSLTPMVYMGYIVYLLLS